MILSIVGGTAVAAAVMWILPLLMSRTSGSDSRRAEPGADEIPFGQTDRPSQATGAGEGKGTTGTRAHDPAVLLKQAFSTGNREEIRRLAEELARTDLNTVLGALEQVKPKWRLLRLGISACVGADPKAVAHWAIQHLPRGGNRSFALHEAVGRWALTDAAGAVSWAGQLADEHGRECVLRVAFEIWAKSDPAAAAAAAIDTPNFKTRSSAIGSITAAWARKDLRAAAAWAWGLPEGPDRIAALVSVVDALRDSRADASAPEILRVSTNNLRRTTVYRLASLLGMDKKEAGRMAREIPGEQGLDPAFRIHLARWARESPDEATEWANLLSDDISRASGLAIIAGALARTAPDRAAQIVDMMPEGTQQESARREVAHRTAHGTATESGSQKQQTTSADNTPSEATLPSDVDLLPWRELVPLVEQLPDGPMRDGLAHRTAVLWGADDPEGAIAWISEQLSDERPRLTVRRAIICEWAARDAGSAIAWAQELSGDAEQEHAMLSLILELARSNPATAANLVAEIPAGSTRNNAIRIAAFRWALVNAAAATEWAKTLSNEQESALALEKIQAASGN